MAWVDTKKHVFYAVATPNLVEEPTHSSSNFRQRDVNHNNDQFAPPQGFWTKCAIMVLAHRVVAALNGSSC